MRVKRVSLTNFRNYQKASADLSPARNILIGENAQGKTNFLEAIELLATGRSSRAGTDQDLINAGCDHMRVEIVFAARGTQETLALGLRKAEPGKRRHLEKRVEINGLTQSSTRGLAGRLVAVSFKSQDLYLLRGGPKYRREWIDTILATIRPSNQETFNKYEKVVTQRNRLLKTIFESGRLSASDQDELKVWDVQLAKYGANIVRQRLELLAELQPKAQKFQEHLSGQKENLTAQYELSQEEDSGDTQAQQLSLPLGAAQKTNDEQAIAESILRALRDRRGEEIARKQTVVGPHRDDIGFAINGRGAVDFASQGQQRSLVLSLKLAELERVSDMLTEPPLLLLDDVLAELDLLRQGLLMSLLSDEMQTVITTTHVDGFKPEWLAGALFLDVTGGTIQARHESCAVSVTARRAFKFALRAR